MNHEPTSDPFEKIAPFYDELMSAIPYAEWVEYVELLVRRAGKHPNKVVDLATGTGTVAMILAEHGYEVMGLDFSEAMLVEARKKAERSNHYVEFVRQDLATLDLPQEFELAVCLYDSLNYLLTAAQLQRAFRGVFKCLLSGGAFVFDVNSVYALEANFFTQQQLNPEAPIQYHWTSSYDGRRRLATVEMDFRLNATGEMIHVTHRQRAYPIAQLARALERAGFTGIQSYDAFSLLPPGVYSDRIYFLALKP